MRPIILFLVCMTAANADTVFSGYLSDPANTALRASDLSAPRFDDDLYIANNVAIYDLSISSTGPVQFLSTGFLDGRGDAFGADPYFSLFNGLGNDATFFDSNYFQAFSTGGDL